MKPIFLIQILSFFLLSSLLVTGSPLCYCDCPVILSLTPFRLATSWPHQWLASPAYNPTSLFLFFFLFLRCFFQSYLSLFLSLFSDLSLSLLLFYWKNLMKIFTSPFKISIYILHLVNYLYIYPFHICIFFCVCVYILFFCYIFLLSFLESLSN